MSEIGSRALSPGINDPGTAIDIIVRISRIIRDWSLKQESDDAQKPQLELELERVFVPALDPGNLLEDAYGAIGKDGVGSVKVGIWLQRSLALLAQLPAGDINRAAQEQASIAFDRLKQELTFPHDLDGSARHTFPSVTKTESSQCDGSKLDHCRWILNQFSPVHPSHWHLKPAASGSELTSMKFSIAATQLPKSG
ncbi:DUF2254 family protein [Thalassorhabdomicrobium marinisediminis]|uniref:Uncharacterized protein n=1 Tax=Thalassorhabdomicrobium marinisediminis TaxID=2170577 RepID=A0A2T7FXC3_9RHOB|nr:DUF2254 family protein [Thalassorhabdomicrobium marinisediminis]PVA06804.1 hypothetical protein DC363_06470 [Thalassorhabdomicrobium marinisediminis]